MAGAAALLEQRLGVVGIFDVAMFVEAPGMSGDEVLLVGLAAVVDADPVGIGLEC